MKVIKQSFQILPESFDPIAQIAERSRICYKSEDKAKENETPFVMGIIKNKHNSCLEMYVEHIWIKRTVINALTFEDYNSLKKFKYIKTYFDENGDLIVTGSVRAFREFILSKKKNAKGMCDLLLTYFLNHPNYQLQFYSLFKDLIYDKYTESKERETMLPYLLDPSDESYFNNHHEAVLFITNRAVTHELVRHRPVTFLQESQRYCRYSDDRFDNEVTFIEPTAFPIFYKEGGKRNFKYFMWERVMKEAEDIYLNLLADGASPQAARTVLTNSCKTEIIVYTDLRQWSHIFAQRAINPHAEPSMLEAMKPVHEAFCKKFPMLDKIINPELKVGL